MPRCAAAEPLGIEVVALHVHHGLNAARRRLARARPGACLRWARRGRPVSSRRIELDRKPAAGESVEAWARQARYRALCARWRASQGIDLVLLAHHRRDQAETFLLQALRGAGPGRPGGDAARRQRDGMTWARPWLAQPRGGDRRLCAPAPAALMSTTTATPTRALPATGCGWPGLAGADAGVSGRPRLALRLRRALGP